MRTILLCLAALALAGCDGKLEVSLDPSGAIATLTSQARIDRTTDFWKPLGTNGRSCATCHVSGDGWSFTPADARARFQASGGLDPLFDSVDGTDSPLADRSTLAARHTASSLLLERGTIRVALGVPADADFDLVAIDDPTRSASPSALSLFRRPLPTTNLRFLTAVMWDGRESLTGDLTLDLEHQANDAVLGHAQGRRPLDQAERASIVGLETALATAQIGDLAAGPLLVDGATGGPFALAKASFFPGINDPFGGNPTHAAFDNEAITVFDPWEDNHTPAQEAIGEGEELFYSRAFVVSGVGSRGTFTATCTTCHDTPGALNHSLPEYLDTGVAAAKRRSPRVPLYTLLERSTGHLVATTDPGRALVTGRFADVASFKVPVLRGLAARAPYFHDGSAATVEEVVDFYDKRFAIGLSAHEKAQLAAFLRSL